MLELILIIVVLLLDQASKALCASWLPSLANQNYPLIKGVFELSYVENRGAAFGMLQNKQLFFIILTAIVAIGMVWLLIKRRDAMYKFMRICLALILAGALGNLVDRIFLGYVRDMFYFALIDFAVFNVADAAITVGGAMLIASLFFTREGRAFFAELEEKDKAKKAAATDPENEEQVQDAEEQNGR